MENSLTNNLLSDLDSKLNIHVNKFSFEEYTVITKITKDFKIFLPKEITDFIRKENNFFSEENSNSISTAIQYFGIDKEKFENFSTNFNKPENNNTIDLTENIFIRDLFMLKSLLSFFGSINKHNDKSKYKDQQNLYSYEIHPIENSLNYTKYLEKNLSLIFDKFKLKDLQIFTNALKSLSGINLKNSSITGENFLYNRIKTLIMQNNKILITIAPSNNFWVKTDRVTIGTVNYDKKINNYNFVFFNTKLIKKFNERIAMHPRCQVGYVNSMLKKNLEGCIDSIQILIPNFQTDYVVFDQVAHENISQDKSASAKPVFVRSLEKMINISKSKNFEFNETNIVVLESENDKAEGIKANMIPMNVFTEEFILSSEEEKREIEKKVEKFLDYLEALLNECDSDVREYLVKNQLKFN